MDWTYGRLPGSELRLDELEAAVHRRLCALVESRFEVDSVLEDAWSHLVMRLACASSGDEDVWSRFVRRETKFYAHRLEASRSRAPLISDEKEAAWLCGKLPTRLARVVGARHVESSHGPAGANFPHGEEVFSMSLVWGRRQRSSRRRRPMEAGPVKRAWADCTSVLARRELVALSGGDLYFGTAGLFEVAAARFERCLRAEVERLVRLLSRRGALSDWIEPRLCGLVVRARVSFANSNVPSMDRCPRRPMLRVIDNIDSFDGVFFPSIVGLQRRGLTTTVKRRHIRSRVTRLPPCMARMHHALRHTHHLRHHARFQYATFLKSVGLEYAQVRDLLKAEYAVAPWSKQWYVYERQLKSLFDKDPFGYLAHACASGMTAKSPKPNRALGEFHGCPFRFDDADDVLVLLRTMGVKDPSGVLQHDEAENESGHDEGDSARAAWERHCCARAFAALHSLPLDTYVPAHDTITENFANQDHVENGQFHNESPRPLFTRPADWVYFSFKVLHMAPTNSTQLDPLAGNHVKRLRTSHFPQQA